MMKIDKRHQKLKSWNANAVREKKMKTKVVTGERREDNPLRDNGFPRRYLVPGTTWFELEGVQRRQIKKKEKKACLRSTIQNT